jgi:hypothetical protein
MSTAAMCSIVIAVPFCPIRRRNGQNVLQPCNSRGRLDALGVVSVGSLDDAFMTAAGPPSFDMRRTGDGSLSEASIGNVGPLAFLLRRAFVMQMHIRPGPSLG